MKASLKCSLAQVLIASILSIACETHSIPKKIPTKPNTEGTGTPAGDTSGGGGSSPGPLTWQISDLQGYWATECLDLGGSYAKQIIHLNAGSVQIMMCDFPSEVECNTPSGTTGIAMAGPSNSITLYPNELKEESILQGKDISTQNGFYFYSLMTGNDSSVLFWGDPDSKDKMVYQIISVPLNVLSGGILDYDTLNGHNLDFYQRDLSQLTLADFWDYELTTSHHFSSLAEIGCSN